MESRFIRPATFGQGSYGKECVLCGDTDYDGPIIHKAPCYAIEKILDERKRQDEKFPNDWMKPPSYMLAILMEEVGEVAECIVEGNRGREYGDELVQVAAVAVWMLECFWTGLAI